LNTIRVGPKEHTNTAFQFDLFDYRAPWKSEKSVRRCTLASRIDGVEPDRRDARRAERGRQRLENDCLGRILPPRETRT
jgi:hypothetical protein